VSDLSPENVYVLIILACYKEQDHVADEVERMVMYFNPLKVLMSVALFLLGLVIAKGIYDLAAHPFRIAVGTILIFVTGLLIASHPLGTAGRPSRLARPSAFLGMNPAR
jgi:hypothetical protein